MADDDMERDQDLEKEEPSQEEQESEIQNETLTGQNDYNDPLFLHPSENTSITFGIKFKEGDNFASWKRAATIVLKAKNKYGLVTGQVEEPEVSSERYPAWERCNHTTMAWILNSVDKEIGESIVYCPTAHRMWLALLKRYELTNGPEIYAIQKEISLLQQGEDSVGSYFSKLKKLWDRLDSARKTPKCSCGCTCGADKAVQSNKDEDQLMKFLDGLNENFKHAKGTILLMNPLPDLERAYSLISQDQKLRRNSENQDSDDSITLAAKTHTASKKTTVKPNYKKGTGQTSSGRKNQQTQLKCSNCAKLGHSRAECWWIVGFPEKQTHSQGRAQGVAAAVLERSPDNQNQSSPVAGFTVEQIDQLAKYMEQRNNISKENTAKSFGSFSG